MERICLQLLGKGVLDADAENLDVQGLELAVVGLPGRKVRRSDREITTIEFNEHQLLPPELVQADILPQRAGEREVRCLLSDLKGWGHPHAHQDASQQYT
jgi:hypothetical protein